MLGVETEGELENDSTKLQKLLIDFNSLLFLADYDCFVTVESVVPSAARGLVTVTIESFLVIRDRW